MTCFMANVFLCGNGVMYMVTANEAIGKRLTWDEIVSLFPDRWVGISDYDFDGAI